MGIPSYFAQIIKKYKNILKKSADCKKDFHNLYLDSNSIIYDAIHQIESAGEMKPNPSDNFELISATVCKKIQAYIDEIRPSNTIYIAFDGVAPFAKMKQQRNRRFMASFLELNGLVPKKIFNTIQVTPGTDFMIFLSKYVSDHFSQQQQQQYMNIIVSGEDDPGEGEHKMMNYIRKNGRIEEKTVIYGLDADLVMLSINVHEITKMFLYREVDDELHIVCIDTLCASIREEMGCEYDYVFLCFLLGNDFLPHFPALSVRNNGIDKLMDCYRETGVKIIVNKEVQWNAVNKVFEWLGRHEERWMIEDYKKIKYRYSEDINDAPQMFRQVEVYVNPTEKGWQTRYYKSVHNGKKKEDIVNDYIYGLNWVERYYREGCEDERWKWECSMGPLLKDVKRCEKRENRKRSVSKKEQKEYVIPVGDEAREKEIVWEYKKYIWEGSIV
jgi:5'-3' exonuclease